MIPVVIVMIMTPAAAGAGPPDPGSVCGDGSRERAPGHSGFWVQANGPRDAVATRAHVRQRAHIAYAQHAHTYARACAYTYEVIAISTEPRQVTICDRKGSEVHLGKSETRKSLPVSLGPK